MFDDITRTALQRPSRGRGSRRYGFSWFHLVIYLLVVILIWSIRFSQLYIYECVDFAFQVNFFFSESLFHMLAYIFYYCIKVLFASNFVISSSFSSIFSKLLSNMLQLAVVSKVKPNKRGIGVLALTSQLVYKGIFWCG